MILKICENVWNLENFPYFRHFLPHFAIKFFSFLTTKRFLDFSTLASLNSTHIFFFSISACWIKSWLNERMRWLGRGWKTKSNCSNRKKLIFTWNCLSSHERTSETLLECERLYMNMKWNWKEAKSCKRSINIMNLLIYLEWFLYFTTFTRIFQLQGQIDANSQQARKTFSSISSPCQVNNNNKEKSSSFVNFKTRFFTHNLI